MSAKSNKSPGTWGRCIVISLLLFSGLRGLAQLQAVDLVLFNSQIDNAVVTRDTTFLKKVYSEDFVFSHGSGRVDGKTSWLGSVGRGGFMKRIHDSVTVEKHGEVAILRGRLNVEKKGKEKVDRYWLKYIRVYAFAQDNWKMISHITTAEFHLPE